MKADELEGKWSRRWEEKRRVVPDYGGFSIASVPAAIRRKLQGGRSGNGLEDFVGSGSGEKVLLVLLDGLGYYEMKRNSGELPFFNRCLRTERLLPITTVFPSTTSAAITTLHTGKTPAEHGLLEWYLYLREIGMLVESLPFVPRLPDDFPEFERRKPSVKLLYGGRTLYSKLARAGIGSVILQPSGIVDSVFSRLISKGAERMGYSNLQDAYGMLSWLLQEGKQELVHFYYPGIDSAGHAYGPSSDQYLDEMRNASSFLEKVAKVASESGFTLIVTADHGQVDVKPQDMILLDELDGFDARLAIDRNRPVQPYGSPRDVIVGTSGDSKEFRDWISSILLEEADVLTTDDMIREGYFGKVMSKTGRERMSDVWILPRASNTVWYRHYRGERFVFNGMHGGASLEEMIVPLIVL